MDRKQCSSGSFVLPFSPSPVALHIHPVKKIAFKGFPSTQTRRPAADPSTAARRLTLSITSTQPLGLMLLPAMGRFNQFKAEQ
jgi:hypothetical protein